MIRSIRWEATMGGKHADDKDGGRRKEDVDPKKIVDPKRQGGNQGGGKHGKNGK